MLLALVFSLFGCRQENLLLENDSNAVSSEQLSLKIVKVEKSNPLFSDPHLQAMTYSEGGTATVDMNQVINIQKGGMNSYTFKVFSNDSNAHFQNIVITEFPDGTVTKKLITFSLTDSEKDNLRKGLYVNLIGKTSIQNFTGTIAQFSANSDTCFEQVAIDLPCGENIHSGSSQANQCKASIKPRTVYKYIEVGCSLQEEAQVQVLIHGTEAGHRRTLTLLRQQAQKEKIRPKEIHITRILSIPHQTFRIRSL